MSLSLRSSDLPSASLLLWNSLSRSRCCHRCSSCSRSSFCRRSWSRRHPGSPLISMKGRLPLWSRSIRRGRRMGRPEEASMEEMRGMAEARCLRMSRSAAGNPRNESRVPTGLHHHLSSRALGAKPSAAASQTAGSIPTVQLCPYPTCRASDRTAKLLPDRTS
jgi:hypothetical protein